ncbi:hypothetical protein IFM89_009236 [Coptis chinensis]|uniref:Protein RETICULATA-RELATED 1, chloroplastic n=1 Tax=Coptis chinensis TaxID=261450 RepID=A0A835M4X6_9MAGN|nr:hypothetical protein IFM89_009236 [Coptis chinensis]
MSHSITQITALNPNHQIPNTKTHNKNKPLSFPIPRRHRPFKLVLKASTSASSNVVDGGDSLAVLERCFQASPSSSASGSTVMFAPTMKGGQYGAFGAVTLEKSKLDMTKPQTKSSPELFDRKFVDAVLNEWHKTMMDLPSGLRQAYEMGLVSSAQMVRYLAINARPTTARFISRAFPQGMSRAFIGRMIADPAFLYKLLLEQAATVGSSVWWEFRNRKERIKQEWDLALINVLTVSACNAIVVWSLAPCRSYGNTFRFDLQNTIQKLPNNIFERSYPQRSFDIQKRIHSFFYKAAELCMVGVTAGAAQGALSKFLASKKGDRVSVTMLTVSSNAFGYGAFLGLYANLRYQLLCGIDKSMMNYFDVIGVALFFSTALRVLNTQVGETSRLAWLGVEADPLVQSENLLKAYNRSSEEVASPSSKWFISKNAVVSGLGLLGIKQGNNDHEAAPPKTRRKRIVRKKVTTTSA